MKKVDVIAETLLHQNKKICSSSEIYAITKDKSFLSSLINTKRVIPIPPFRGYYYVPGGEERLYGKVMSNPLEILSEVLNKKFGDEWYLGGPSALFLLGITHQYPGAYHIFNKKISMKKESDMFGKLVFTKINSRLFNSRGGIIRQEIGMKKYPVSGIERTLADYVWLAAYGRISKNLVKKYYALLMPETGEGKLIGVLQESYPEHRGNRVESVVEWLKK